MNLCHIPAEVSSYTGHSIALPQRPRRPLPERAPSPNLEPSSLTSAGGLWATRSDAHTRACGQAPLRLDAHSAYFKLRQTPYVLTDTLGLLQTSTSARPCRTKQLLTLAQVEGVPSVRPSIHTMISYKQQLYKEVRFGQFRNRCAGAILLDRTHQILHPAKLTTGEGFVRS